MTPPCLWTSFFLTFLTVSTAETDSIIGNISKNHLTEPPPRPTIPNTFQVKVEAVFKNKKKGVDGTLYFDLPNNIATTDVLYRNDFERIIFSFDTNEMITIKGYKCTVKDVPDDPNYVFFPFTVDPDSKRKVMAPAEKALYFEKSEYVHDNYDNVIESQMYQVILDLKMYNREKCTVIHLFSKPDFETAACDSRNCEPLLLAISVKCPEVPGESEEADHMYRFFQFTKSIADDSVFHPPPGVFCKKKNTKSFPVLPTYFSFSYDVVKHDVGVENVGGLQTFHKKVWYDGDMQLIRVDGYDKDGLLYDTHIYDFYNGMSYISVPSLEVRDRADLPEGLTLELITLLPSVVFPMKIQNSSASPSYMGPRKAHGLEYHVWSVMTEIDNLQVVTEMYFTMGASDEEIEVKESGLQLSFLEIYIYTYDDEEETIQLSEVKFVPISNFQSASRDWAAFDVSWWFDSDEKRTFEISITGDKVIVGGKFYSDFLEQLYLEIVTAASVSLTRISKLEMLPYDDALQPNTTRFRGMITESLKTLGYNNEHNESDLNTSFSQLAQVIKEGGLEFTISDNSGQEKTFILDSFEQVQLKLKPDDKDDKSDNGEQTYTGSELAGITLGMLAMGLLGGVFSLSVSENLKARKAPKRIPDVPNYQRPQLQLEW